MKTLKCIDYQQGKILVDEQAEIKKGDLILVNNEILTAGGLADTYGDDHSKIIAQTPNLNLEGIPYVELEDDVEKLMYDAIQKARGNDFKTFYELAVKNCSEVYKAQPKKYTEDDLRKAIAEARMSGQGLSKLTDNEIIKSLQPKIESVEIETTISLYKGNGTYGTEIPITYQRDGRTYLKVTKINYG
jgi:hypothetical protein